MAESPPAPPPGAPARVPPAPQHAPAAPVDAHRYTRRRTLSALVRGDAVPPTDPLRTRSRATLAGALLGLLGLAAAAVVGLVDRPVDWRRASVVVGAGSGALAVVAHGPDRLVPVTDLSSARLVAAALAAADPTGAAAPDPAVVPVEIDDAVLATVPRSRPVGIVGAPAPPPASAVVPPVWTVCDTAVPDPASDPPFARPRVTTTVRAGAGAPGQPLGDGEGLLLRERSGATWLVHDRVRSRVDTADAAVVTALGLAGRTPRPATASLLAAVPEGPAIVAPVVAGRGAPGPPGLAGEPVGGVVRLAGAGLPDRWLVIEADGVQEVPALVARLVRLADPSRAALAVPAVAPGAVAAVPGAREIRVEDCPGTAPVPVGLEGAPTTCASASADRPGTTLTVAGAPGAGAVATPPAWADGSGDRVDAVILPASGVVVRGVPAGRPDTTAPTVVIGPTGRASTVPDPAAATALGLGPAVAVPASVLALLPPGPALTVEAALTPAS